MNKLDSLGFGNTAIEMIRNYLSERKQRVKLGNASSDWIEVKYGVPQGTVLGPLLFNLYVNDLHEHLDKPCQIIQYADDTCLFLAGNDPETVILGNSVEILTTYYYAHNLMININKTQFIIIRNKRSRFKLNKAKLTVFDNLIEQNDSAKYLGIEIDKHLDFNKQTNIVLKKMAIGIRTIPV